MKKYGVFGAGLMGRVIAADLLESEPDAAVDVLDIRESLLQETKGYVRSDRLRAQVVDATDRAATVSALGNCSVAICALPHGLSLPLIDSAIEAAVSLVDLVGEAPEERAARDERARRAGCLVIPGCGVAPGISNICVGRGIELLDETENALIYVGGIPKRKEPPLFYQTVYCLESVFDAYQRKVTIVEKGKPIVVEPLGGLEEVSFPEPIGKLEAFYTDGLCSLPLSVGHRVKNNMFEKTLRYPGHVERVQTLKQCGLLGRRPVQVAEAEIRPVDLLLEIMREPLRLGPEGDILVMRIIVEGTKDGKPRRHTYELIDTFDLEKRATAMARTTGFPATCAARMIAGGELKVKGVVFPEQVFVGERFDKILAELASRGVKLTHREEVGEA